MSRPKLTPKKLALLSRLLQKDRAATSLPLVPLERQDGQSRLSFAQEQLWTLHRLDPESAAYNVHVALPLDAAVPDAIVERSLAEIVRRHEILRSTFADRDGQAVQIAHPAWAPAVPVVDLRGNTPEQREHEFARLNRAAARAPFDLEHGPVMRATLVRVSSRTSILLLTLHHIVTDGWSMGVLFTEFRALVTAFSAGEPSPLPELPLQYADVAEWQRVVLDESVIDREVAYWRERLAGITPLELPADRPRPALPSFDGQALTITIDREATEQVRALARRAGVTLFTTLLAAFRLLLRVHADADDIVIGAPINNRDAVDVQRLIGYFVNMLALRSRIDGRSSVLDTIAGEHAGLTEALAHQELPFERLASAVSPQRDPSRSPVFQVVFSLLDRSTAWQADQATGGEEATSVQNTRFDLEAHCLDAGDVLRVTFAYSTDLFERDTIARLAGHFDRVLRAMASNPSGTIDDLPIVTAAERATLLTWGRAGLQASSERYPRDASLSELFAAQVATRGSAVAVECGDQRLTYAELDARSNQVAQALRTAGVGLDCAVGLWMPRGVDLIVAVVGVIKAGAAYVAVDVNDPPQRVAGAFSDAGVRVMLAADPVPEVVASGRVVLGPSEVRTAPSDWNPRSIPADALAYIAFTSGSTGRPKGVLVPHRGVVRLVHDQTYVSLDSSETVLQLAPVHFDASTLEIWGALLHGARLVVHPERVPTPAELGAVLRDTGVTTLWLTASLYNVIIDAEPGALRGVRQLLIGGEALSVPHVRDGLAALKGTTIINGYGPTENTTFTCCYPIGQDGWSGSVPLGPPIAHTQAYVLDGSGSLVPSGVPGELYVGGDGLARGYAGSPRETAARFVPDGVSGASGARLYRTGDRVRWRPDATLEYLGRRDSQVKLRGFRIELGEVESALSSLDGVAAGVAQVRRSADGPRLVAHVVPAPGATLSPATLRAALQARLPGYMVPSAIGVCEQLPLTASGKVDRLALPDPEVQATAGTEGDMPSTPVERALAELWRDVLRVGTVGLHDNFFDLGGDSILSIQIVSRARARGLALKPKHLFQHPTIAELASVVASAGTSDAEGPVAGRAPLTPVQRWFVDAEPEGAHHFNQSVLLRPEQRTAGSLLRTAVAHLLSIHDVLRSRFSHAAGRWEQVIDPAQPDGWFEEVDLSSTPAGDEATALGERCSVVQASFDLERGPLFKAVLFDLGAERGQRLLLVAHHLVVDAVSWRILLDDLSEAWEAVAAGQSIPHRTKTTSYLRWAHELEQRAATLSPSEVAYWTAVAGASESPAVAVDPAYSPQRRSTYLSAAQTTMLLREAPRVYEGRVEELLLAALVRSLDTNGPGEAVRLDLESHGRSEAFEGIDVSRTVGWFTSIYPVVFKRAGGEPLRDTVTRVRQTLADVPGGGLGYGMLRYLAPPTVAGPLRAAVAPAVAFNYLGQFDQMIVAAAPFTLATEPSGRAQSPQAVARHALEIVAVVSDGCLRVEWTASAPDFGGERLDAIVAAFDSTIAECVDSAKAPAAIPAVTTAVRSGSLEMLAANAPGPIVDEFPVTPMQHGMLFQTLLHPESGAYTEVFTCELHGPLDVALFERAWAMVVARHDALRSVFVVSGVDEPHQVVLEHCGHPWVTEDWSDRPADERAAAVSARIADEERRRFDLADGPLMAFTLLRLGDDITRFIWSFHHVLLDGWSMAIVLAEVSAAYEALADGDQPRFPDAASYGRFARWLAGRDRAESDAYWRNVMAGVSVPTPLGLDDTATAGRAPGSSDQTVRFDEALTAQFVATARTCRVTLNTLLVGMWGFVLSRYSGRQDVVFGTTVSGRPADLPGAERMVGLFINTVPVRVTVPSHVSVDEWLRALQAEQTLQQDHQHVSLSEIARVTGMPADVPFVESLLVFENYPSGGSSASPRLRLVGRDSRHRSTFPVVIAASPGSELLFRVIYDTAVVDDAWVSRLMTHLRLLAERITAAPHASLDELSIATKEERARLLQWGQAGASAASPEYPRDASLAELFSAQVARRGSAVALECGDRRLTYAELDTRSNQVARALRAAGVGLDAPVGLWMSRGIELIVALVGVIKAGAAYVAVDTADPPQRVAGAFADAGVRVIIAEGDVPEAVRSGRTVLGASDVAAAPSDWTPLRIPADALAYVAFTSGSTGRPKGVLVPHRGVTRLVHDQTYVSLSAAETLLQLAPVHFDASTLEIWGALLHGARLVVYPERVPTPSDLAAVLRTTGVTTLWLTASLYNLIIDADPEALRGVRQLLIGGEALSVPHVRAGLAHLRGTTIINGYGPTENTTFTCCYPIAEQGWSVSVPLGPPIAHTQAYVLDPGGALTPEGVPGELYVGGDGLARGYAGAARETAARFVPDGVSGASGARLYRTGDRVRWRHDGTLEYLGRRDTQVKLRGFRIELAEVEAALSAVEGVAAAVAQIRRSPDGARLIAHVTPAAGVTIVPADVRAAVQQRLPAYMVPSAIGVCEQLPLTASGKLDRLALPEPAFETEHDRPLPVTEMERRIADIWSDVLGAPSVSADDNFFVLGGHSLVATRVISRLRDACALDLPLVLLFDKPVLRDLAAEIELRLDAAKAADGPALAPVPRDHALPLSSAQQRLWFLDQLEPGSAAYNVPAALRLTGTLDPGALDDAFTALTARHEVLRTTFATVSGEPVQVIAPHVRFTFQRVDLRHLDGSAREQEAARLATLEATTAFDLQRGPLLRGALLRLADDQWMLLLTLHHIVCDAWSLGRLVSEVMESYRAAIEHRAARLASLPLQYADFAVWHRAWLETPVVQRQLDYWTTRLADAPMLELPLDRPRPAEPSHDGGWHTGRVPERTAAALRRLAAEERATLFMTLLASFDVLLARYTGQSEILVGVPVAVRPRKALEPLIGFFSNNLVMRSSMTGHRTFRDLLRHVRSVATEAYANQDLPFERIVEAIHPDRHLDRHPIFQVVFTMQHAAVEPLALPGLTIEPVPMDRLKVRFDLEVHIGETADGLITAFYYNADVFEADTVARIADTFGVLLERLAEHPDADMTALDLVAPAERKQLRAWNATARPIGLGPTLHGLVEAQAARTPHARAVEFGAESLSYAALNGRANQLARLLRAKGAGVDDCVAIAVPRGFDQMIGVLAAMKAGAAYLPLDLSYPAERLTYMLRDGGAKVVITERSLRAKFVAPESHGHQDPQVICIDGVRQELAAASDANLDVPVDADHLAYVLYTSGSTGRPKGIAMPHRPLLNLLEWQIEASAGLAAGRTVQYAPLSFDPSFLEMFSAWSSGGTLVLIDEDLRRDYLALVRFLDGAAIDRIYITPAALHQLADASHVCGVVPRSLREVNAAGERLEVTQQIAVMLSQIPGCTLFNQYGPAETHVVTVEALSGHVALWPVHPGIGVALPNTRLHIRDHAGEEVLLGVAGELFISGDCLARGYLGHPRLTAERFVPDGSPDAQPGGRAYRSGDLARYRRGGSVEYLGRRDNQIKVRGQRVELGEVESVLKQHAIVLEAAADARELTPGNRQVVAFVVTRPGQALDAGALRAHAALHLPEYMLPAVIEPIERLPLTPSGKIDRRALPALRLDAPSHARRDPRTEVEARMAAIWCAVLGRADIGVDDDFFAVGGHSLLAAQLVSRVRVELGVELRMRTVFEAPTIAELSARVEALRHLASSAPAAAGAAGREEGTL